MKLIVALVYKKVMHFFLLASCGMMDGDIMKIWIDPEGDTCYEDL